MFDIIVKQLFGGFCPAQGVVGVQQPGGIIRFGAGIKLGAAREQYGRIQLTVIDRVNSGVLLQISVQKIAEHSNATPVRWKYTQY